MVEFFGEELFLQGTFSIHWLIWIQLLLLLLLLLLLPSSSTTDEVILTPSVDTPLRSSSAACATTTTAASTISSSRHRQKKKLEEEDSKLDRRRDGVDGDDSSGLTEAINPCHIVRLARMAFLECFGLGPPKDNPICRARR